MAPQSALFVCERDKHDKGAIILQLKKKTVLKRLMCLSGNLSILFLWLSTVHSGRQLNEINASALSVVKAFKF